MVLGVLGVLGMFVRVTNERGNFVKRLREKITSLLTCSVVLCAVSGCGSIVVNVKDDSDGNVDVSLIMGVREDYLPQLEQELQGFGDVDLDMLDTFDYEGCRYQGIRINQNYDDMEQMPKELFWFEMTNDGGQELNVNLASAKGYIEEAKNTFQENATDETLKMLDSLGGLDFLIQQARDEVIFDISFTLPGEVYKVSGRDAGFTIDGDTVTLNFDEIDLDANASELYWVFATRSDVAAGDRLGNEAENDDWLEEPIYSDVYKSDWYYKSVQEASVLGLLKGVGNGMYAPSRKVTVSELAQIIMRLLGENSDYVGYDDGNVEGDRSYWAFEAVACALANGYVKDRGSVVSSNYSVPVTREEAVAALNRASGYYVSAGVSANIPDYSDISIEYQHDVVSAYSHGLIKGVDSSGTFNPKGYLTRAEIAQLVINLENKGIISKAKV